MCGIIGYSGPKQTLPILLGGLSRLEYRGYDSAGIAITDGENLIIEKKEGKLQVLKDHLLDKEIKGNIGIGHTRWATHGGPSDKNAHPHHDNNQDFAIIHNGIIENYAEMKEELLKEGYQFESETDEGELEIVTIKSVEGNEVTIDVNHPLAGVTLNFDVEIVGVRKATAEEIEHEHVH